MAANANVVDELVVLLRLDAKQYKRADKEIDALATATERKARTRDKEAQKRMKESAALARSFGNSLRSLAGTIGTVIGITGTAGLVGAVVALTNFETNLRRQTISTGLSTREMQAWGSAARRLGADASAGAQAIADLAREQKQFNLTGNAPTMQALARMGVRVGPNSNIADVLSQAQSVYRAAGPGQRQQYEAGLSASGVSADLITLIKSDKDVRAEYDKSFKESADANRDAMDAVASTLETLKNNLLNIANTIITILKPNIEAFAEWTSSATQRLSEFASKVIAAGGGVDGFMKVLEQEQPGWAKALRGLIESLDFLGDTVDVVVYGFQSIGRALSALFTSMGSILPKGFAEEFAEGLNHLKRGINREFGNTLNEARREGAAPVGTITGQAGGVRLTPGAQARINAGALGGGKGATTGKPGVQDVMGYLIASGLNVQQAAAIAANIQGESGFDPTRINYEGGGQGARGLFQHRGSRIDNFRARYGITPDQATWQQQLDFILNDPYERSKLNQSFAAGGTAGQLGSSFSRIFEAHGNFARDMERGRQAQIYAQQYNPATGAAGANGPQVNINGPVTVQANNPTEFMDSLSRVTNIGNYSSGVR